jgi:TolB-like protein/Flp pilus assembly protein TadD
MTDKPTFFSELKRRNVYKVAVAFVVVSWLVIQAASIMLPAFEAPAWVMKVLISALVLGFPIAMAFSWAFEITPEGIKRESAVAPEQSIVSHTGRKLAGLTIMVALMAAGLLAYQRLRPPRPVGEAASFPPKQDGKLTASPTVPTAPVTDKSIAVLPFDNLSDEKSNAYFAEGIQDEILTRLAKVADLKVISRTSTQHFKSTPENLPDIARQLGVMNILEGSVQRSNDQVRVNVQLINALTDAHLWADMYDRKLTDIFTVESDIAKAIADTLQAKLTGSEERALSARPTENQEAYQLYLQGRFFWNKRNAPDLRKSVDCFHQAIALDPKFAQAYAGLAQAWVVLPAYNGGSPDDCYSQAEVAANKALAIDQNSVDALATLGSLKANYHFDIEGALRTYERVLQLNPNDATVHHWYGSETLAALGQQGRELSEMNRAAELDPLSLVIQTNLGNAYLHNGQLDHAISHFRKVIEMDQSFYFARWSYGFALELQGKIPEAIAQYETTAAMTDDPAVRGYLGHAYAVSGRKADAEKILGELEESRRKHYVPVYNMAVIRLGLGDRDGAFRDLEQGFREHDGNDLLPIRIDPLLAPLRDDPRFVALAEKIVPARLFKSDLPK